MLHIHPKQSKSLPRPLSTSSTQSQFTQTIVARAPPVYGGAEGRTGTPNSLQKVGAVLSAPVVSLRSLSRPSTSQSSSPLSRKEIEQLYIGGCSPLAVLTSDEISEMLSGAEAAHRMSGHSQGLRSLSSTPSLAPSPDHMFGLSSSSSLPTVKSCDVSHRSPPGSQRRPLVSPLPSLSPHCLSPSPVADILKRAQFSTFRRNFTLKVGASIPTSGCAVDTSNHFQQFQHQYACIAGSGGCNSLPQVSELEAFQRQEIDDSCSREFDRIVFAFSRKRRAP
jgi:hypothetical protein